MLLILFSLGLFHAGKSDPITGSKLRFTNHGLKYVMDVSMTILQKNVKRDPIQDQKGGGRKFRYELKNGRIEEFQIGNYKLKTLRNNGIHAAISDIKIKLRAKIKYTKKLWMIKIRDTVNVEAKADGGNIGIDIRVDKYKNGRPSLTLARCDADIGSLKFHFSGSIASVLYNIAAKLFNKKIKKSINKSIRNALSRSIGKVNKRLLNSPVRKQLDPVAIIDYGLALPPTFTDTYMDAHIKGYFEAVSGKSKFSLPPPSLSLEPEKSTRMVYFWLSDYTFNTAGEIYHNSGILTRTVSMKNAIGFIKPFLMVNALQKLVPGLYKKYPNSYLDITIKSGSPPKILMRPGDVALVAKVDIIFRVLTDKGPEPVFGYTMDLMFKGSMTVSQGFLKGKIAGYRVSPSVKFSNVGKINIPLETLKEIFDLGAMKVIKPKVTLGLPLPNFDEVALTNTQINIKKGYMVISTDLKYTGKS